MSLKKLAVLFAGFWPLAVMLTMAYHNFYPDNYRLSAKIDFYKNFDADEEQIKTWIRESKLYSEVKKQMSGVSDKLEGNNLVSADYFANRVELNSLVNDIEIGKLYLNLVTKNLEKIVSDNFNKIIENKEIKLKEEISLLDTQLKIKKKKFNEASRANTKTASLFEEYRELSNTLGLKHPKMEALRNKINLKLRKKLTHEQIIILVDGNESIDSLNEEIVNLTNKQNELLSQKKPRFVLNIISADMPEVPWWESLYFKMFIESLVISTLMILIIKAYHFFIPNFKNCESLKDETGIDKDLIINFPRLKPKQNSLELLPHLFQDVKMLPDNKQIMAMSKKVVEIKNHQRHKDLDQQALENLAAEIMIKSKDRSHKFYLFSSSVSGAGSTTVVANLAVAFSNLSEKVLVVDANFNNSALAEFFGLEKRTLGIADLMIEDNEISNYIQNTQFESLDVLPLGVGKEDAAKMLTTDRFLVLIKKLSELYNFVLIDGGSIVDSAQATLLATQIGAVYLVVNANNTPKDLAKKALARLERIKVKLDGVVLNQVNS